MLLFESFQKIPRLSRDCVISEKLDGTNAHIHIFDAEMFDAPSKADWLPLLIAERRTPEHHLVMLAGSRNRYVTPGKTSDNYGFAAWAQAHADELFALGLGRHYGEWWGAGIARKYGLTEKRFSLFNVAAWGENPLRPACCSVVPVLYRGLFSTEIVGTQVERLKTLGSVAAPGFRDPEGIVVWHEAARVLFKKTLQHDEQRKGEWGVSK